MSIDTDAIIDRRRLKRRLFFWRTATVIVVLAALITFTVNITQSDSGPYVAKLDVFGVIIEDELRQEAIEQILSDDDATALVVYINSPGGSTYGSERLYKSLRRVAEKKPVITVIGTIGASGGYMTALAGDHIFAGESSITGSIGVIVQTTEFSALMDKLGVTANSITSGKLKGEPSPFKPMSEEGRKNLQEMVNQTHNWFVDMVAARRPMDRAQAETLADGGIQIGLSAVKSGLIDSLGGVPEARRWLESERDISLDLPLVTVDYSAPKGALEHLLEGMLGKSVISERLTLDGLISLWHPN
ncbi:signal peptide peptidase SppA [Sneathiella aquimaris]|uniref:signal peptide peptidase SppA n=1 Tax=Sneathiella aquimaris TaxID=2599305 RepID=UPI00146AAC12|nr:signal peptide peptidase SppA [Sneathiella aquimaris]